MASSMVFINWNAITTCCRRSPCCQSVCVARGPNNLSSDDLIEMCRHITRFGRLVYH